MGLGVRHVRSRNSSNATERLTRPRISFVREKAVFNRLSSPLLIRSESLAMDDNRVHRRLQ